MTANPLWLQFLVSAAPALLVGLLAWLVSRGQLNVAEEKLRHDLFERRFAIFYAFQVFMLAVANTESSPSAESVARTKELADDVVAKLAQARFVFDQPTFEYLRKTFMAVGTLHNMGSLVKDPNNYAAPQDQVQAVMKLSNERMALFDQIDQVAARVAPQIRLRGFGPR